MRRICAVIPLALLSLGIAWIVLGRSSDVPAITGPLTRLDRPPCITPDYREVVIPPNIAPLHFRLAEQVNAWSAEIWGEQNVRRTLHGKGTDVRIPTSFWRSLLDSSAGGTIRLAFSGRHEDGGSITFEPFEIRVAREPVDPYLAYRIIDPVFGCWGHMSIRQRDLSSFAETAILRNRTFAYDCSNCHTFHAHDPSRLALQIRSQDAGACMVVADGDQTTRVYTATEFNRSAASYSRWHPNGRAIAFAAIKVMQFFHAVGHTRDVFDEASDLAVYLVDENLVTTTPAISDPDWLETYPEWSPDGSYLYFCRAPQKPVEEFRTVKYDLMRIAYNARTNTWGELETMVSSADTQLSVTHPRVSPDGRYLLFTMCEYGNFSIYRPDSDLHLLDLTTGKYVKLPINSDRADSYHSWSTNGRWIVFSSKRRDGLFTHPYLSYFDEQGNAHRPFILPQQDPGFYESYLKVFNVPEFVTGPVRVSPNLLTRTITEPDFRQQAELDPQVTARDAGTPRDVPWHSVREVPGNPR